ncbi:MAG: helix-turn-helix transcriptional regulator [Solirubrobacteraceae bacterium]
MDLARTAESTAVIPFPLEREAEIARLGEVLGDAAAGRGQLLVIEGPSGIGKSRLLDSTAMLARTTGVTVLRARGGELEREYAFGLAIRLLEPTLLGASPSERHRLLRGRASLAAPLLAPDEDRAGLAATSDEFALVHGLYWCMANLAEDRPLVVLIDDVQWADELSMRFLVYVASRLQDLPAALIVALRTGDPDADSNLVRRLVGISADLCLRPAALTREAVAELLAAADLELAEHDDFVDAAWKTTGGNPFLLRELIATLASGAESDRAATPGGLADFAPRSVARQVLLRLSALGEDVLEVARACAVVGDQAPLALVADVAGLDVGQVVTAVEKLVAAQFLTSSDPATFVHPMIRSAVYDAMPPGHRPAAHTTTARALHLRASGSEAIAHHLLAGVTRQEEWMRTALHDAGRSAARKGAPNTAVRYLRRALELTPPDEPNTSLLIDLGLVEAASGHETSLERFEQALAMLTDVPDQARTLYALGQTLYRFGRNGPAATTFLRGATLFDGRDDELALMFEGAYASVGLFSHSLHDDVIARLERRARPIASRGPKSPGERVLLALLAAHQAMATPPVADALTIMRHALEHGALLREQTSDGIAITFATTALLACGENREAQEVIEAALDDARERGSALAFAEAALLRGYIQLAQGRIREAMADAQTAIDGINAGWHATAAMPHALLALCHIERDELDQAEALLREGEQTHAPPEFSGLNAHFFWARGSLRLARSRPTEAREDFLNAGQVLQSAGVLNPALIMWRSLAGLAAHSLGDDQQALELIDQEVALAQEFGLPTQEGIALARRACILSGTEGTVTLERAVALLETSDNPLELARALLDLGRRQRHLGASSACREPLRRALDLAAQCGATRLERDARDELLASGARPRRTALSGFDALTPSEQRIATLAATGSSNRQIAEGLFLTKSTVGWHLSNIYRKLDLNSRAELRRVIASEENELRP